VHLHGMGKSIIGVLVYGMTDDARWQAGRSCLDGRDYIQATSWYWKRITGSSIVQYLVRSTEIHHIIADTFALALALALILMFEFLQRISYYQPQSYKNSVNQKSVWVIFLS
jgi:hypothetical protein